MVLASASRLHAGTIGNEHWPYLQLDRLHGSSELAVLSLHFNDNPMSMFLFWKGLRAHGQCMGPQLSMQECRKLLELCTGQQ